MSLGYSVPNIIALSPELLRIHKWKCVPITWDHSSLYGLHFNIYIYIYIYDDTSCPKSDTCKNKNKKTKHWSQ